MPPFSVKKSTCIVETWIKNVMRLDVGCCQGFTWSKLVNDLAVRSGSCPRCATCTRPWPLLRPSFLSTRGGKLTGSPRSCWARTSPFLLWYLLFRSKLFFFFFVRLTLQRLWLYPTLQCLMVFYFPFFSMVTWSKRLETWSWKSSVLGPVESS